MYISLGVKKSFSTRPDPSLTNGLLVMDVYE
jgi:hypothetical protein